MKQQPGVCWVIKTDFCNGLLRQTSEMCCELSLQIDKEKTQESRELKEWAVSKRDEATL